MKILYISPVHVSGTLALWQKEHQRRGNECRYVTLMPNSYGFPEDICLHLPLHPDRTWLKTIRDKVYRITRGPLGEKTPLTGQPPYWRGDGMLSHLFFAFRDFMINPLVKKALNENDLHAFDIIHLDQGAGFCRDARFIRKWHQQGKMIVAFYHGSDMRNRGIFRNIDDLLSLRLTSEVDLLRTDPRLRYLFLPFDTSRWRPEPHKDDGIIRIVHTARVRYFKGTDHIITVIERLKKQYPIEVILIENMPHHQAMEIKKKADIAIDQISDTGGWGYGMSSVEYLSLGIPTCTSMRPEMEEFLPDHPFVSVTPETLEEKLIMLIENVSLRKEIAERGREWVVKYHDIQSVGDQLYRHYQEAGIPEG